MHLIFSLTKPQKSLQRQDLDLSFFFFFFSSSCKQVLISRSRPVFMGFSSQNREDLLARPKSCIACSLSIRWSCLSEDCSSLAVAEQIPSLMQC